MKKGQSAMEFLMTYGWAILIVLVVLSSLYFLGVFSPKTSNTYFIQSPLLIQDLVIKNNGILFKMSSNLVESASVTDIYINGQSCSDLNGFLYNTQINEGAYTGCGVDLSDYDKISGSVDVRYSSESGLTHDITGQYSGSIEEGSIANIFQDNNINFNLYDNNLVFGWHGDSLIDYASGRTVTANGGVNAGGVSGYFGGGTQFDGVDDWFNGSFSGIQNIFSISYWIKTTNNDTSKGVAGFTTSTGMRKEVYMSSGKIRMFYNNYYAITSGTSVNDGNWHYVVGTYDGTTPLVYIDGVNNALGSATSVTVSTPNIFRIGQIMLAAGGSLYFFNGTIDEVHIWNRALSDEEVSNLYGSYN